MTTLTTHGHPILIIGAGRGGSALLEMFMEEDSLASVIAIVDPNPEAPGIKMAKDHGIPTYADAGEALQACRSYPDCIVYNLTYDDAIGELVAKVFANQKVVNGIEAKLFWQTVNNLQRVKKELEKNQSQLQAVIHNAMDGIITINQSGEIQGFNPAAEKMFGYLQQEVLGKNVKMLMPEPTRSEHDTYLNQYLHTGHGSVIGIRGREVTAIRKNGELFQMELSASDMILGGQRYFVGIVRDITDRKLAESKITFLAHHDYLTGLPNRALFLERLEQAISLAKRNYHKVAILYLDLDGFKKVNDAFGHDVGDLLLQDVAKRLTGIIRCSDTVARLGGDEFTIVLINIGAQGNAATMANKIIDGLSASFDLKGQRCQVGGSIGIAIFPDDAEEYAALLKYADEAMYLSKHRGKNTYTFYSEVSRG